MPAKLRYSLIAIFILGLLLAPLVKTSMSSETTPPHSTESTISCNSCHTFNNPIGPSSTKDVNETLCMSCHSSGGTAPNKPFAGSDQADLNNNIGTSHSWSGTMPATDKPDNQYGLRSADNLTVEKTGGYTPLKYTISKFSGQVTCSVCHNVHTHWGDTWVAGAGVRGKTTSGTFTTLTDTTRTWTVDQWKDAYVSFSVLYGGNNAGKHRKIVSNTANTLTVEAFPKTIPAGINYFISKDRRFLRVSNAKNELCEDCHYYRTSASGQTSVKVWTGKKLSHPVNVALTVGDTYNTVPLEPAAASWASQTGAPRYDGSLPDNNTTNNMVFDSTGKIRCLTCHNVHYADSNSATIDAP